MVVDQVGGGSASQHRQSDLKSHLHPHNIGRETCPWRRSDVNPQREAAERATKLCGGRNDGGYYKVQAAENQLHQLSERRGNWPARARLIYVVWILYEYAGDSVSAHVVPIITNHKILCDHLPPPLTRFGVLVQRHRERMF